jgi:protein phosphatase
MEGTGTEPLVPAVVPLARELVLRPRGDARAALALSVGCASGSAPGKPNEDFFGLADPGDEALAGRGLLLAVADGVSGDGRARVASGAAVRTLLEDFYTTNPDWTDARGLDTVMRAANDWIAGENHRRPDGEGVVTTLSALLLRAGSWRVAHVGDSRVYRMRQGRLAALTRDHTWPRRDMRHVLRRAVGLDSHLVVDCADGPLEDGDVFLLATDGVWEVLGERALADLLADEGDPAALAAEAVVRSLRRQAGYMGRNDATAVVVRVNAAG